MPHATMHEIRYIPAHGLPMAQAYFTRLVDVQTFWLILTRRHDQRELVEARWLSPGGRELGRLPAPSDAALGVVIGPRP